MLTFVLSLALLYAVLMVSMRWRSARRPGRRPSQASSTESRRCSAMPAIIDSAPDCIIHVSGAKPPDDSADFILQAAYQKCAGS